MAQVIGFNLAKVTAERTPRFKAGATSLNLNIEFTSVDEDTVSLLKDSSVARITFQLSLKYAESEEKKDNPTAEIVFGGTLLIALEKDELKDLLKSWKKKTIPDTMRRPLMNLVMARCAARALMIQEDLGLPSHIPIPQIN
jgi:hypothetical protein